jgi:hypothetical protein
MKGKMAAIFNSNREERRVKVAIRKINSVQPWFYKQHRFLMDDSRYVWQMAASQSGKTEIAVPKFLRRVLANQMRLREKHGRYMPAAYWIVAPTQDLCKIIKAKMSKYFPQRSGLVDRAAQNRSGEFWNEKVGTGQAFMKYGAKIVYRSFEQKENLVAETTHGIWVDECARCDDEVSWGNIFARGKETKGFIIGTSSPAAKNAFYTKVHLPYKDHPDHSWLNWTSLDSAYSPYSSVTVEEVERARETESPHMFAREWMAEWANSTGMVYDTFSADKNVVSMLPFSHDPTHIVGLDFGKNHPTAFEIVRFDGEEFICVEETTLRSPAFSDIVKEAIRVFLTYSPYKIYYDYGGGGAFLGTEWAKIWKSVLSGSKSDSWKMVYKIWCEVKEFDPESNSVKNHFMEISADLARKANVSLDIAYKNVTDGIEMVHAGITSRKIRISSVCKNLIGEIDGYVWKEHESKDEPVKENDDHLDALRYAIATYSATKLSSSRAKDILGVAA